LPHEWIRLLGFAPIFLGVKKLVSVRSEVHRAGTNTLAVATVTFANGADNIGIYTPLFAVSDVRRLLVLIGVLYALLLVWCVIAYRIHTHQAVAKTLRNYGHWLVPVILIGLGLYILLT